MSSSRMTLFPRNNYPINSGSRNEPPMKLQINEPHNTSKLHKGGQPHVQSQRSPRPFQLPLPEKPKVENSVERPTQSLNWKARNPFDDYQEYLELDCDDPIVLAHRKDPSFEIVAIKKSSTHINKGELSTKVVDIANVGDSMLYKRYVSISSTKDLQDLGRLALQMMEVDADQERLKLLCLKNPERWSSEAQDFLIQTKSTSPQKLLESSLFLKKSPGPQSLRPHVHTTILSAHRDWKLLAL
ncbi:MAG: hypothetical protein M1834_008503 [Cirrosporium novae-zelandiae]|nr:MAG: hypothetical protein M1834_008503 [Cirrosporium novae-zelandiae]